MSGEACWPGRIAYVGAGKMGEPMARLLVSAGAPLSLHARRPEVRAEFEELGARASESIAEVVADACVVCVCLFDETQLRDVLLGDGGLISHCPAGAILVCHTTTGVRTLEALVAAADGQGVDFVDAPVSGSAEEIAMGRLTVLAGGSEAVLHRISPILGCYSTVVRTGEVGSATRAKLVNNLLFAANLQLVAAAVQLARALGVAGPSMLEVLAHCSAGSEAVRHVRGSGLTPQSFGERASPYLRKDVAAALAAAADVGADPAVLEKVVLDGPVHLMAG